MHFFCLNTFIPGVLVCASHVCLCVFTQAADSTLLDQMLKQLFYFHVMRYRMRLGMYILWETECITVEYH